MASYDDHDGDDDDGVDDDDDDGNDKKNLGKAGQHPPRKLLVNYWQIPEIGSGTWLFSFCFKGFYFPCCSTTWLTIKDKVLDTIHMYDWCATARVQY